MIGQAVLLEEVNPETNQNVLNPLVPCLNCFAVLCPCVVHKGEEVSCLYEAEGDGDKEMGLLFLGLFSAPRESRTGQDELSCRPPLANKAAVIN